jgi:uncharacterized protein (TIGR00730 family)
MSSGNRLFMKNTKPSPGTTRPLHSNPKLASLVEDLSSPRKASIVADMLESILGLGEDDADLADLKLFRRALREMRYAASIFKPYREVRKVAVFGSARTNPEAPEFQLAEEFSRKMTEAGYMIITGGGDGIMGAAQKGAGAEKSFGLNIKLPFEQQANETIAGDPKLVDFNYFFTRKLNFMKETHAFVLLPGGFGTQDEGFESLTLMQTGKTQIVPVILLDKVNGHYWETWRRFLDNDLLEQGLISQTDFHLFHITHSADQAMQEINKFYSVFHSYRWVKQQMVIRINRALSEASLGELNNKFGGLLVEGCIEQRGALPEERDDVHLVDKPRLVLTPAKKDFGLFRLLINHINESA